jgi:hypothetical protein
MTKTTTRTMSVFSAHRFVAPLAMAVVFVGAAVAYDRFGASLAPVPPRAAKLALAAAPQPRPSPAIVASLAPPASPAEAAPAKMSRQLEASFDQWLIGAYLKCWSPAPPQGDDEPYVARVRLEFARDGSLARPPKLINPPSNPAWRPEAKGVMRAVQNCNPLKVPSQYGPYYEQWKMKTVHFDPQLTRG